MFVCLNCADFVNECDHTHLENYYTMKPIEIEDARTDIYFVYASKKKLLEIGVEEKTIFENIAESKEEVRAFGLQQAKLTKKQCEQLIPEGNYCYTYVDGKFKYCPFWDKFEQMPTQDNGYCHYLKSGDWQHKGLGLLWDQCKDCGVNEYQKDYAEDI